MSYNIFQSDTNQESQIEDTQEQTLPIDLTPQISQISEGVNKEISKLSRPCDIINCKEAFNNILNSIDPVIKNTVRGLIIAFLVLLSLILLSLFYIILKNITKRGRRKK